MTAEPTFVLLKIAHGFNRAYCLVIDEPTKLDFLDFSRRIGVAIGEDKMDLLEISYRDYDRDSIYIRSDADLKWLLCQVRGGGTLRLAVDYRMDVKTVKEMIAKSVDRGIVTRVTAWCFIAFIAACWIGMLMNHPVVACIAMFCMRRYDPLGYNEFMWSTWQRATGTLADVPVAAPQAPVAPAKPARLFPTGDPVFGDHQAHSVHEENEIDTLFAPMTANEFARYIKPLRSMHRIGLKDDDENLRDLCAHNFDLQQTLQTIVARECARSMAADEKKGDKAVPAPPTSGARAYEREMANATPSLIEQPAPLSAPAVDHLQAIKCLEQMKRLGFNDDEANIRVLCANQFDVARALIALIDERDAVCGNQ